MTKLQKIMAWYDELCDEEKFLAFLLLVMVPTTVFAAFIPVFAFLYVGLVLALRVKHCSNKTKPLHQEQKTKSTHHV